MSKLLLFLGAGASAPLGIPTSKGFVAEFDEIAEEMGSSHWGGLRIAMRHVYGESRLDIELVIATLAEIERVAEGREKEANPLLWVLHEMGTLKDTFEFDKWGPEAKKLRQRFENHVREKCVAFQREKAVQTYRGLFDQFPQGRAIPAPGGKIDLQTESSRLFGPIPKFDVYTTNYDLSFRAFCNAAGIEPNDGFISRSGVLSLDSYKIELQDEYRYFHLHGAVGDDLTDREGVIRSSIDHAVPKGSKTLTGSTLEGPAQIFPVQEKEILSSPYLHLYAQLVSSLRACDLWMFVGFSFNDRAVANIVHTAYLRRDRPVKVIICNRSTGRDIAERVLGPEASAAVVSAPFGSPEFNSAFRETLMK